MDVHADSSEGIPLVITEADIDARTVAEIRARRSGDQVLGDGEDSLRDAIPAAVLKRISRVIPLKEYQIVDVTLKFSLGGDFFGVKLGGDVAVKLAPKKEP